MWIGMGEPGAGEPHDPPCYLTANGTPTENLVAPPSNGQDKLVLITHGRATDDDAITSVWEPLRDAIRADLWGRNDTSWNVQLYDWSCDSNGGFETVLTKALSHGYVIGQQLSTHGYRHVHLIGHSAGSGVIQYAARELRRYADQNQLQLTIHTTFLDAYGGDVFSPDEGNFDQVYGRFADWSDHYYSRDLTGRVTQLQLPRAYNLDVTEADPAFVLIGSSSHSWPHCFYRFTVNSSCTQPIVNVGAYGYPLSFEVWPGGGSDIGGWLNARSDQSVYAKGRRCRLPGPACARDGVVRYEAQYCEIPDSTPMTRSSPESVQGSPTAVSMTKGLESVGEPAWASLLANTPSAANQLQFDLSFAPSATPSSFVSVYVNGVRIAVLDQRAVTPGRYGFPIESGLTPGEHVVAFRIDGYAPAEATVFISNMGLALLDSVAICTADFDGDGDIGTDADIEAFFACLAGNCCATCASPDFNGDGDVGTDADIESFFRVLAGGAC